MMLIFCIKNFASLLQHWFKTVLPYSTENSLEYTCSNNVAVVKLMLILVCIYTRMFPFKCLLPEMYHRFNWWTRNESSDPQMAGLGSALSVHHQSGLLGNFSKDTKLRLTSSRQLSHAFKEAEHSPCLRLLSSVIK